METPTRLQRTGERSCEEDAIVQQNHQRRRHHHRLAAHPQRTGGHGGRIPPTTAPRLGTADDAVQRQQVEQPHQRLAALDHVRHALGLQWVNGPDQGGDKREPIGLRPGCRSIGYTRQRPAHHSEQGQRRQEMERQIERMIAPDVQLADRVVDGQREIDDRPPSAEHLAERPELPDALRFDDVFGVVEQKHTAEAADVHHGGDDHQ